LITTSSCAKSPFRLEIKGQKHYNNPMSKISLLLIAILLIAAGIYSYIKLTPQNTTLPVVQKHISSTITPTSSDIALVMSPVSSGPTIKVLAVISPPESKTGLVQLEIGFDPNALTAVSVLPGTYFAKPKVFLKTVNQHLGRISYALGCVQDSKNETCQKNPDQPAAIITFTRNIFAKNTVTYVRLFPKTILKTNDNIELPFKTHDATLTLSPAIAPAASNSALSK
jgi:hypothetical protein